MITTEVRYHLIKNFIDKLSVSWAARFLTFVPLALILFHLINLLGFVPANIIWTGRASSPNTLLVLGLVSILLNGVIAFCGAVKSGYLTGERVNSLTSRLLPFVFWWLVGNTIANLFSKSLFEVAVFTPILILLTVCSYRVKGVLQTSD